MLSNAALVDMEAAYLIASGRLNGTYGQERDQKSGVAILKELSGAGYAPATATLADCYSTGIGLDRDQKMADQLYLKLGSAAEPATDIYGNRIYRGPSSRPSTR